MTSCSWSYSYLLRLPFGISTMQKKESGTCRAGYRSSRMRKLAPILVLAVWLIPGATAFAGDNGEGLYGETDDKVVTSFALGVVIFFALFVILASALQAALD